MTQNFIAQVALPSENVAYTGGGSILRIRKMAQEVLPHLQGGPLFAYLFRRFGYPSVDWDEQKQLVCYLITTPLPEVFLSITPYMGESPSTDNTPHLFTCCLEAQINETFISVLSQGGYQRWRVHPLHTQLEQAVHETLSDLLRPVPLRDLLINCYGIVPETTPGVVECSPMAGYSIPSPFFQSLPRWEAFCHALTLLGEGSLEEGILSAVKMAAKARSDSRSPSC